MVNTIFDPELRKDIIQRATSIHEKCEPKWGKMNVSQMLRHCKLWDSWVQGYGEWEYFNGSRGLEFEAAALKAITADNTPINRNANASNLFIVTEIVPDFESEKQEWIQRLEAYSKFHNPSFIHDFFGFMNKEQIGILAYKHNDHHLRQFGV
ncbi:MAG TPA: DUF1569 domain-containing protein [Saprospiraceae bacterium]|nr:DUF1569 domain-containing protein [Saprospiraceae bacterium]HPN71303.1 DUF1569 domain-containing protein [Saprospiraceae bacterium]